MEQIWIVPILISSAYVNVWNESLPWSDTVGEFA